MTQTTDRPAVCFILPDGQSQKNAVKLWGLPLGEWQARAFKKAGADAVDISDAQIVLDVNWVLSSALASAFVSGHNIALTVDGVVVGINGGSGGQGLIGTQASDAALSTAGLTRETPDTLGESYNKALRKTEPPYALDTRVTPILDIMRRQFDSSYKGITDFVTKYFWPLPAFYVTRACAALRLTPNMVTTVGLVLCIAAYFFFMQGQWALGFLTGWLMTFLDTVDGKLARTTMTYSAWGNIYDHGIDLIHPPFWYYAWFIGLGGVLAWPNLMTIALVAIMVGYVVDRIIEGIFIGQHGFHIHVWRPFNSLLRIYTARRNPNTFIFMLAIMLSVIVPQAGVWGFYAVAIWTWVCIAVNIIVVIASNLTKKPVTSWMDEVKS